VRIITLSAAAASLVLLSGCSVEELAAQAADAAACSALGGTVTTIEEAYLSGSAVVSDATLGLVNSVVGDQLNSLLSSGLAADLNGLTEALSVGEGSAATEGGQTDGNATDPALNESAVLAALDSIRARCEAAGVVLE
jgi:hypothetical protein